MARKISLWSTSVGDVAYPAFAHGTVVLNGTTPVAVSNALVTADSVIVFTLKTVSGTVGAQPVIETITPGTGFTVAGSASDDSTYNYAIFG
jgi:hypothetical protein